MPLNATCGVDDFTNNSSMARAFAPVETYCPIVVLFARKVAASLVSSVSL